MKISHESPLYLINESKRYNDYDYALVHLFEEIPEYYNFFKKSLEEGREVLLDNSIFELGTSFDVDRFAYWVNELKPTEFIIPDVLENCVETINKAEKFLSKHGNLAKEVGAKTIGVIQGKTYDDIVQCYTVLDKTFDVDKIAISFDYSYYYEKAYPHPNKWVSMALGRQKTIMRLLNDGIINTNKPHHLLGCALPIEFMFYRNDFPWIESLDTSNPVVHGILGIRYEPGGLYDKQSIKLVDLIHHRPTLNELTHIYHNIQKFREIVEGVK